MEEKQQKKPALMLLSARRSVSLSLPSPPSLPVGVARGAGGGGDSYNTRRPLQDSRQSIAGPLAVVNIIIPSTADEEEEEEEEEADDTDGVPSSFGVAANAIANPQSQQLKASSSPNSQSPQYRRKASLMPPVTEEDLRNDFRMGHRDPESVAALFGDDFASRFCLPGFGNGSGPGAVGVASAAGTMPISMQQLRQGLDPDQALLPHEIRDSSVPSGIPIVKMRRRVVTQPATALEGSSSGGISAGGGTSGAGTDEAVVPLSPVAPKFPSLPCFLSAFTPPASAQAAKIEHLQNTLAALPAAPPQLPDMPGVVLPAPLPFPLQFERDRSDSYCGNYPTRLVPFRRPEPGQFYPDMAVSNPDLVQFQLVLNNWFQRQCKLRTSAFLLNSAELNMTLCQVCGTELANEEGPIQCGDAEFLDNLFDGCAAVAGCSGESQKGMKPDEDGTVCTPSSSVVAKLDELTEVRTQNLFEQTKNEIRENEQNMMETSRKKI